MDEKRRRIAALDQYRRFMHRLAKSNMETLMLSGIRAPCMDEENALKAIGLIEDICSGIYGKTGPAVADALFSRDLGEFDPESGIADLIRILS